MKCSPQNPVRVLSLTQPSVQIKWKAGLHKQQGLAGRIHHKSPTVGRLSKTTECFTDAYKSTSPFKCLSICRRLFLNGAI